MVAACREGQKRLVVARQPTGGLRVGPLIMWDKNYLSIIRKIFLFIFYGSQNFLCILIINIQLIDILIRRVKH